MTCYQQKYINYFTCFRGYLSPACWARKPKLCLKHPAWGPADSTSITTLPVHYQQTHIHQHRKHWISRYFTLSEIHILNCYIFKKSYYCSNVCNGRFLSSLLSFYQCVAFLLVGRWAVHWEKCGEKFVFFTEKLGIIFLKMGILEKKTKNFWSFTSLDRADVASYHRCTLTFI